MITPFTAGLILGILIGLVLGLAFVAWLRS
jgi:hypothetical protein